MKQPGEEQPDQGQPNLEISMSVINIGEAEVAGLKDRLSAKTGEPVDSRDIRKMLRPAKFLRSILLSRYEIALIQKYAGFPTVDEEHSADFKEYMKGLAAELGLDRQIIEAPTLPAETEPVNGGGGKALTIAGCLETVQARILIKGALCNFYGVTRVPTRTWSDDTITRPMLAMSYGTGLNDLLLHLQRELSCDDELLPPQTEIGGFNTEYEVGPDDAS